MPGTTMEEYRQKAQTATLIEKKILQSPSRQCFTLMSQKGMLANLEGPIFLTFIIQPTQKQPGVCGCMF